MKSCLSILFLFFLIVTLWWGYNSYSNHCNCEECKKNLDKYYFHFENWDGAKYYVLECFCDTKPVLQKMNSIRKKIMTLEKVNLALLIDDFYNSGIKGEGRTFSGGHDDVPWEDAQANLIVGEFELDKSNAKRLSYMLFEYKWDTLYDKKVERKELSRSWGRVIYNIDYEELNRSVLNQFAQTVYKDSTRFAYNTCVYHLYNRQAKKVEATMKYEDKGKGFYFEIW